MGKQLLYMYIDELYGFEQQQFNFSTDVRLSLYGEESLILQKNHFEKTCLKGFWGENISDISVLIGDNGSGKTTLIKIICRWLSCFSQGHLPQEKGILVFRQDGRIGYIGFEKGDKLEFSVEIPEAKMFTISELIDFTKDLRLLYFSNTMTELNLDNDILDDYSLSHRILKANKSEHWQKENIILNFNREEFRSQVDTALNEKIDDFPVHYLQMEIQYLKFEIIQEHQLRGIKKFTSDLSDLWDFYFGIKQESKVFQDKLVIINLLKSLLIGVIDYILVCNKDRIASDIMLKNIMNCYILNRVDGGFEEGIECFKQFLTDFVLDNSCSSDCLEMKDNIVQFIGLLQSYNQNVEMLFAGQWRFDSDSERLSIGQIKIESENREKFKRFWEAYKKVDTYMKKVSYCWMASSGERNWVSLFSILTHVSGKNIWLFLDEPDNTLHPDWQRKLLEKIFEVCNGKNYSGKNVQLWITTHSPIMLSDMPGNAIIYLKDKENLDCQMEETFGQNIYALFNHAFFLHDGVIGTFASNKIKEVLNKLQNIEKTLFNEKVDSKEIEQVCLELEYCEKIADLLAEPLFKRYMMDSILYFRKVIEEKNKQEEKIHD